jgi:hypothetical protein
MSRVVDLLDPKKTVYENPSEPSDDEIVEYAFRTPRFDGLFKIPQTSWTEVFYVERSGSDISAFEEALQEYDLRGLEFELVYSR